MSRAILRDSELLVGRAVGQAFYRENATEPYVECPPALIITASDGKTFTLGNRFIQYGRWYEFEVDCNGVGTGEFAVKIVYQHRKVRIYGRDGWRVWTGINFV
jgi:hypothetical protein